MRLTVMIILLASLCVFAQQPSHFQYDAKQSLSIQEAGVEHRGSVAIHDISYASPKGGRVPAFLVVPEGKGPFPAVLWGHWYWATSDFANRKEFLDEAVVLAKSGVVSLMITGPIGRPDYVQPKSPFTEEPIILSRLKAGERIDHYETQRVTKTGEILDISLTISPLRDSSGRIIGASKIARDITERKRAEAALIQSEKLAATGRMAAVIAHEINNPLEAVTNLGYLLSVHPSLNDEARKYAHMLLNEVERASDITRQTLAFYRDTTRTVDVNLTELFESLLDLHRSKLAGLNIKVTAELDRTSSVRGYAAEIRQVMVNLLLNAIDAIHNNGRIRIRVRNSRSNDTVRITVADTGHGISEHARKHLFEPFFTTKQSKGNGLGLWVSLGIVNKHRGRIQVRSKTGSRDHGTVFSVVLPRQAEVSSTSVTNVA